MDKDSGSERKSEGVCERVRGMDTESGRERESEGVCDEVSVCVYGF